MGFKSPGTATAPALSSMSSQRPSPRLGQLVYSERLQRDFTTFSGTSNYAGSQTLKVNVPEGVYGIFAWALTLWRWGWGLFGLGGCSLIWIFFEA